MYDELTKIIKHWENILDVNDRTSYYEGINDVLSSLEKLHSDARYELNARKWKVGDLVIHHADQKHERMLMRVIGYKKNGCAITRYVSNERKSTEWVNDIKHLLDPARFGIPMDKKSENTTTYVLQDGFEAVHEGASIEELKAYAYEVYEIPQDEWKPYYPSGLEYFRVDEGGLFNLFETTEFYIVPKR